MPDGIETTETTEVVEAQPIETTQTEEVIAPELDLASILDNVLKEFEVQEQTQKTFWPNITTPVHENEATVMLEQLQKELETTKQAETEAKTQQETLLSDLEDLKSKYEVSALEADTYKKEKEQYETFINSLGDVPILWELVSLFATKGAEAVNIPKFLKELHESNIMAQGATLQTEATQTQEEAKPSKSSLELALLRRNKR